MRQVAHIFRKEFSAYFISPIAYIVIAIFLLVTGWFFFATFFLFNQANLRSFYALLPVVFAFVIPAITMRLISEEINVGSDEILLTMPVTFRDVILGKFLASVALVAAMLIPTVAYPLTVSLMAAFTFAIARMPLRVTIRARRRKLMAAKNRIGINPNTHSDKCQSILTRAMPKMMAWTN